MILRDPMANLVAASLLFFLIHAVVAGTGVRYWIVDRIGLRVYIPVFALGSGVAIFWMAAAYNRASEVGYDVYWSVYPYGDWAALIVMLPALLLAVAGLTTKNPTTAGQGPLLDGDNPAIGILRVTRHPFLIGVLMWAFMHMLVNPDPASLIFFGTFFLVVLNGMRNIDKKRQREHGEAWERYAAVTSTVPFVAIMQGRNHFSLRETGIGRLAAGGIAFIVLTYFHAALFSVSVPPFSQGLGWP